MRRSLTVLLAGMAASAVVAYLIVTKREVGDASSRELRRDRRLGACRPGLLERQATCRVAGTVVHSGDVVAEAEVILESELSCPDEPRTLRLSTDREGRFDFGPQAAGKYRLVAQKAELSAAVVDVLIASGGCEASDVVLALEPCEAQIHGWVVDRDRRPIGGATVEAGGVSVTDENGEFSICVTEGTVSVSVMAEGFGSRSRSVVAVGRVEENFELGPGGVVSGRVVRADNGEGVEDAIVTATCLCDRGACEACASIGGTGTNEHGEFELKGLEPGRIRVEADAQGLASWTPVEVVVTGNSSTETVILLQPSATVSGRVSASGRGVSGAQVVLRPATLNPSGWRHSKSGKDGQFEVAGVIPGAYWVEVHPGRQLRPDIFDVVAPEAKGIQVEIAPLAEVRGRVLCRLSEAFPPLSQKLSPLDSLRRVTGSLRLSPPLLSSPS